MSDDQAFETFREVRWGRDGEPECPTCGVVAEHWFLPSRRQWRCRDCGHTFAGTSGTIFAHHKLPLQVYLGAVAIYTNAVEGSPALQMSRGLGAQCNTVDLHGSERPLQWMDWVGLKAAAQGLAVIAGGLIWKDTADGRTGLELFQLHGRADCVLVLQFRRSLA